MPERKIYVIKLFIWVMLFLGSSISIVIASSDLFSNKISLIYKSTSNVFVDSLDLNSAQLVLKSSKEIKPENITSECNIFSKLKEKKDNLYLYNIKFFDASCSKRTVNISNGTEDGKISIDFNLLDDYFIINKFLDYNNDFLKSSLDRYSKKLNSETVKKYLSYSNDKELIKYSNYLKAKELEYVYNKLLKVIKGRGEKYISPVENFSIPEGGSKIPNVGRPYRSDYTDGIHHGWDIDTSYGENVIALDDGIIIRVVDNFTNLDFENISYGESLSDDDKTKNLDILRGNQVWLKTMKGDVVFYSHLSGVFSHIKPGVVVSKGSPIGTVGVSGIPGNDTYKDYHLHFAIHKNPYNENMAGKYSFLDYMKWDWYFKGESLGYIKENQGKIFE